MRFQSSLAIALGVLALTATAADAQSWSRERSVTGHYGGSSTFSGGGSCSGGACSSSQSRTGPRGGTVGRSGSTTCSAGSCSGSATYTNRFGQSATRNRSFSID